MKIDIEIISEEYIKPSSPTPAHLRRHQLSLLDKLLPPILMPWIMFYPKDNIMDSNEKCDKLKHSLSEALTLFYPLAGRIKKDEYVDCNDQGAYFVQTKADSHLSDVLNTQDLSDLNRLIPIALHEPSDIPAMVQVTFFTCGGLSVAILMSHGVGDALSLFMFLNSWAAISRGDTDDVTAPKFEASALFPPPIDTLSWLQPRRVIDKDLVAKRFVFNASSVSTLVKKYTNNGRCPTRFEALCAFMWSRLMDVVTSHQLRSPEFENDSPNTTHSRKLFTALHAVNLRPRMDPPLSNDYFGNIMYMMGTTPALYPPNHTSLVDIVRENVKKVNVEFVKDLQQNTSVILNSHKKALAARQETGVVCFIFTSLSSFAIHGTDFGWGKPVWVSSLPAPLKNLVTFYGSPGGDGIEAWVNLKEEDMVKFANDKELLSYVS